VPVVRYLVDDVDEALPFYEALGFELVDRLGPPFAIVAAGGLEIWLSGRGTSARRRLASGELPEPGGWNRIVVTVDDLEGALERVEALGVRVDARPIEGPGGRQALVADPSGNRVELFQPAA
jgi:catechol 2,3-dioxygenase-like lactoylglutathione lyase family enzyme